MIPQSELLGCRECGVIFWSKARTVSVAEEGKEVCPNCGAQHSDTIDRSS